MELCQYFAALGFIIIMGCFIASNLGNATRFTFYTLSLLGMGLLGIAFILSLELTATKLVKVGSIILKSNEFYFICISIFITYILVKVFNAISEKYHQQPNNYSI